MSGYELTNLAEKDLKDIALYTIDTWGIKQAKHYEGLLSQCFKDIAEGKVTPRFFLKRRPDLLFARCEHHYIFYYHPDEKSIPIILAILHERMDIIQRLKERLA